MNHNIINSRRPLTILIYGLAVLLLAILVAPMPSFRAPLSTVVEADDGTLLGARVAADGQWRFPPPDSLPEKYITCLINYEDRWFRWHPGVNPVAVVKALSSNIRAGKTVRGGSTITMQVARMARGNPEPTYGGKVIEMFSAVKLELFRSKKSILKLYASNAPFGGNTVGIEAAAWRYTGRGTADLTWAEAAMLAVLPNAPALIYPGRHSERLKEKRDRLLLTLVERGKIDSLTCELAMSEPLPEAPLPMPSLAPHLTGKFWLEAPVQETEPILTLCSSARHRNWSTGMSPPWRGMVSTTPPPWWLRCPPATSLPGWVTAPSLTPPAGTAAMLIWSRRPAARAAS